MMRMKNRPCRNDPCWRGSGKNEPASQGPVRSSERKVEQMRETCRAARRVPDKAIEAVRPGVSTDQIDALVHEACIAQGGYPSPRNYPGFPKSVCTSVNEVICHGIPDDRPLENGDIVNIDVTIFLNGFHGDCSKTVPVGDIDESSRHVLNTAQECLRRGIGRRFHMNPQVCHYRCNDGKVRIEPGMIFTIEPMVNLGGWHHRLWNDRWTAVTADGKRSAQFEHTILVTENGPDILTSETGDE